MTETSTMTAQEMADRIVELEEALETEKQNRGHVLALRTALAELREPWDLSQILGAETRRRVERADKVLSHTAQAGREAEDRIINETLDRLMVCEPKMLELVQQRLRDIAANRLRNGGSDNG